MWVVFPCVDYAKKKPFIHNTHFYALGVFFTLAKLKCSVKFRQSIAKKMVKKTNYVSTLSSTVSVRSASLTHPKYAAFIFL